MLVKGVIFKADLELSSDSGNFLLHREIHAESMIVEGTNFFFSDLI